MKIPYYMSQHSIRAMEGGGGIHRPNIMSKFAANTVKIVRACYKLELMDDTDIEQFKRKSVRDLYDAMVERMND